MTIEFIYPEIANLFGDSANFKYLKKSIPGAEFIETGLNDVPAFASAAPSLIYMGAMSEKSQKLALSRLMPYKDRLRELIEGGTHFLFTGNSFELFGKYIEQNGERIPALDILDFYAVCDTCKRYNGFFLGQRDGEKITAFNSRFSNAFPGDGVQGFAKVIRGRGLNADCTYEGVVKNNFIGTYLLGPFLVQNPLYMRALMQELGSEQEPAFFAAGMEAYAKRLAEFEDTKRELD